MRLNKERARNRARQMLKKAFVEIAKLYKLPPAQRRDLQVIASAGGRVFLEGLQFSSKLGGRRLALHHRVVDRLVSKGLLTWERGTATGKRVDTFVLAPLDELLTSVSPSPRLPFDQ